MRYWKIFYNRIFLPLLDLLIRMLQRNPRNRLKLEEVFAHPWMQGETMSSEEYVSVMTSLRNEVKLNQHTVIVNSSPFPSILLSSSCSLERTQGKKYCYFQVFRTNNTLLWRYPAPSPPPFPHLLIATFFNCLNLYVIYRSKQWFANIGLWPFSAYHEHRYRALA